MTKTIPLAEAKKHLSAVIRGTLYLIRFQV